MKVSRTVSFGMGAVVALVLGSGTAYAATGGKFILGKSNSAGATSTLTNTRGSALALNSAAGTPSLKVNRTTKVPNLNSDLLDGLDQRAFALATSQTNTITAVGQAMDVNEDGTNDFIAAVVSCPAGTRLTGGGGDDLTSDGTLFINSPLDRSTWMIASTGDVTVDDPTAIQVYAQCFNPRGAVAGAFRTAPAKASTAAMTTAKARLAKKLG